MIGLKTMSKVSKPMISRQIMSKKLCGNFRKTFLKWEKGFKKDLPALPPRKFFHVYISNMSSCGFSRSSLALICTYEFLKNAKRCTRRSANSAF